MMHRNSSQRVTWPRQWRVKGPNRRLRVLLLLQEFGSWMTLRNVSPSQKIHFQHIFFQTLEFALADGLPASTAGLARPSTGLTERFKRDRVQRRRRRLGPVHHWLSRPWVSGSLTRLEVHSRHYRTGKGAVGRGESGHRLWLAAQDKLVATYRNAWIALWKASGLNSGDREDNRALLLLGSEPVRFWGRPDKVVPVRTLRTAAGCGFPTFQRGLMMNFGGVSAIVPSLVIGHFLIVLIGRIGFISSCTTWKTI